MKIIASIVAAIGILMNVAAYIMRRYHHGDDLIFRLIAVLGAIIFIMSYAIR